MKRKQLKQLLLKNNNGNIFINKKEINKRISKKYIKQNKLKSFMKQYLSASGNELDYKFYSVNSSSRLCFELYSWMALDNNILDIEFEYKLPGLKSIHNHNVLCPTMDLYFLDNNINFIESKFFEIKENKKEDISRNYYDYYIDGNNNISKSVLDVLNIRFDTNIIFARHFIKFVNEILEEFSEFDSWFDLKQEITHLFGIGGYIYKYKPNKNINFYNVIYDFNEGTNNFINTFKAKANIMMNQYIKELGLNIIFNYDLKTINNYIIELDNKYKILNKYSYESNKTINEILNDYYIKI